jgi:glyoxylase-like metal-dependent hydrolase (beta-lactamase superfamily II)
LEVQVLSAAKENKMIIKTVQVGELRTNCYIVASSKTREAVIIDPGDEAEKIIEAIETEKLKPILIVNTHAHPDHVGANFKLAEKYDIVAALGEDGYKMIEDFKGYFEEFSGLKIEDLSIERLLNDNNMIDIGELKLQVINTPGHSKGGICLYGNGVLFSGDTLFAGTYGRTDIPGGSENEMQASIKKLMELPDGTVVYPGHGSRTTIAEERKLYA